MQISIIIPTYNEAENITRLIHYLLQHQSADVCEIIVADGGSTDDTLALSKKAGANAILSPHAGRAAQMNYGASIAGGSVLYFVHADCVPPTSYANDIINAISKGFEFGRYRTRFDSNSVLLKLNAFFTRFDLFVCYGGDQTLFMTKNLFNSINGFDGSKRIMEDYDIVTRAKTKARYM